MHIWKACRAGLLLAGGVMGLASAQTPDIDRKPDDKVFEQNGRTYMWDVAHGLTGSLSLSRKAGASVLPSGDPTIVWDIDIVLTCSGVASGRLQTRKFAPANAPQIRLRMGDVVFRVAPEIQELAGRRFVHGRGDLPTGFFAALASADTVSVEYGGQALTFAGPGAPLADHFHRYCQGLARQAAKDETPR